MKEQEVNDEVLVCRCEEVNEKEIIEALRLRNKNRRWREKDNKSRYGTLPRQDMPYSG